jgi:hypothetical protein
MLDMVILIRRYKLNIKFYQIILVFQSMIYIILLEGEDGRGGVTRHTSLIGCSSISESENTLMCVLDLHENQLFPPIFQRIVVFCR